MYINPTSAVKEGFILQSIVTRFLHNVSKLKCYVRECFFPLKITTVTNLMDTMAFRVSPCSVIMKFHGSSAASLPKFL